MATKEELIQRVGEDLSLVPIGQELEQHDVLRIEATYRETYQRIQAEGYDTWAYADEIPDRAVPYVALMMEEKLLTSYSVPDLRYQRIKADAGPNGDLAMIDLAEVVVVEEDSVDDAKDY